MSSGGSSASVSCRLFNLLGHVDACRPGFRKPWPSPGADCGRTADRRPASGLGKQGEAAWSRLRGSGIRRPRAWTPRRMRLSGNATGHDTRLGRKALALAQMVRGRLLAWNVAGVLADGCASDIMRATEGITDVTTWRSPAYRPLAFVSVPCPARLYSVPGSARCVGSPRRT